MEEEAKQNNTVKRRKQTKIEPKEEQKERLRRPMAEFAVEPHDQRLIEALQAHLASLYGEQRQKARILRASTRHGLLIEIILAGPDKGGLYAGRYTGKELAEMTRQIALLLSDFQARYSTPIFQAAPVWNVPVQVPGAASSNGSVETTEAKIDQKGATALKGLGTGLMKRQSVSPPPPE